MTDKAYRLYPVLTIILCDLVLLLLVGIGIDARTRNAHKYMYVNTASFFYSRAHQLYENGAYPKKDTTCFAPTVHDENYTPGLACVSLAAYRLTKWAHNYNFFEFAVVFPVMMYLAIIFSGYWMMTRLYSRAAGMIFAALFTIMPAADKLTAPCYFTSESVGVICYIFIIYLLIKLEERPVFCVFPATIVLTLLMLTWQLFMPILVIMLISAAANYKRKTYLTSCLFIIFASLVLAHIISIDIIGIKYSPFLVFKELVVGITQGKTHAYSVAMQRSKLKPMDMGEYLKNFTWFGVPLLLTGLGVCARFIRKTRYFIPLLGCVIGLALMYKYIKFRFIALPFMIMVSSIGGGFLFNIGKLFKKTIAGKLCA